MQNPEKAPSKLEVDWLKAKVIYLVDDTGTSRAKLSCGTGERRGHVVVHLYDGDGKPRLTLQVDDKEGAEHISIQ